LRGSTGSVSPERILCKAQKLENRHEKRRISEKQSPVSHNPPVQRTEDRYLQCYSQPFSLYFFFSVKPMPNMATNSTTDNMAISGIASAMNKEKATIIRTASVASTSKIDFDLF